MRGGVTLVGLFLGLSAAVPLASAGTRAMPRDSSMTVTASPRAAGAHAVRLTFTFRYEMQCGYPGAGPVVVTFPSALKLPKRFASGAVQLAKKTVAPKVDGQRVTVTIAPYRGVLCNIRGPATFAVAFTRAARLRSPGHAGSYRFKATHEHLAFAATLKIKPAS